MVLSRWPLTTTQEEQRQLWDAFLESTHKGMTWTKQIPSSDSALWNEYLGMRQRVETTRNAVTRWANENGKRLLPANEFTGAFTTKHSGRNLSVYVSFDFVDLDEPWIGYVVDGGTYPSTRYLQHIFPRYLQWLFPCKDAAVHVLSTDGSLVQTYHGCDAMSWDDIVLEC